MKREQLMVAAIENGTVIDHIPSDRLFEVIRLLHIDECHHDTVFIGYNLRSGAMGKKSIIKIANRFFSEAELNQLSVVAPNVTLSLIKDYEVREKRCVRLPKELRDIIRCNNPKCICNNEPIQTRFVIIGKVGKCYYCEKEQDLTMVKLV
ncbi:aspartate carbamoyltransferase regulatory subunit [Alloprevotella sp. OH1205_COT-284]|uniref:aspartate carbamoyltransferase regulatory subunit n=1 Tax=Alloprevotella sp. OH1205_COT-284 TaxID=2491043 RepID=UPI000F5DBF3B|nr:aspartate carbamoyltransferase regulatory subunit [Alloprevotella sp. OH1205_COT-284]RRD77017.1 aspartate carbamoyltransferase regulatory subunit [Alloprevotella sp. OH1205_COT-284]